MSTSTSTVDNLLAAADREWRALGIHRRDRVTLAADLRAELEAAAADGLDPAELLGADPAEFAVRIAEEAGVERTPPRYGQVLGVATAGAMLSLVVGYVAVIRHSWRHSTCREACTCRCGLPLASSTAPSQRLPSPAPSSPYASPYETRPTSDTLRPGWHCCCHPRSQPRSPLRSPSPGRSTTR